MIFEFCLTQKMTTTLVQAKCFLSLLLDNKTLSEQKKSLLATSSDSQVKAISLIVQNSLKSDLPVKNSDKKKIHKYRKILKKICNNKLTNSNKKKLIKKHYKIILVILLVLKELLEKVIL